MWGAVIPTIPNRAGKTEFVSEKRRLVGKLSGKIYDMSCG